MCMLVPCDSCVWITLQGVILALLGPTLLDIARHVSGSDNSISFIFTARSFGHLIGSITGGVLYDKYKTKRYAMLSASVVVTALCKWSYECQKCTYIMYAYRNGVCIVWLVYSDKFGLCICIFWFCSGNVDPFQSDLVCPNTSHVRSRHSDGVFK